MYKDVLNHMTGAEWYASVGLVLFFIVFVSISLNAILRTRQQLTEWSRLPLSEEEANKHTPEVKS